MSNRDFTFPVSTLIRDAGRLLGALRDETVGPPVAARLRKKAPVANQPPIEFAPGFEQQIDLVASGGTSQSAAVGDIGTLTAEQAAAFSELERLMSGARRSATLAFPDNGPRLRSEFQVGIHEPQDLASELERATKIHAACVTHADALSEHGWIAEDTAALEAAIATLEGGEDDQEAAKDRKQGLTKARNLAANGLYKMC